MGPFKRVNSISHSCLNVEFLPPHYFFIEHVMEPVFCGMCSEKRCPKQIVVFSHVVVADSFATPCIVVHQAPLSMGFPGKDTGVGCRFLLQGIFLTQGLITCLLDWQVHSLPLSCLGRPPKKLIPIRFGSQVALNPSLWCFLLSWSGMRFLLLTLWVQPILGLFVKSPLSHPVPITAYISNNRFLSELLEHIRFVQYYRALIFWSSKGINDSRKQQHFLEIWVVMIFGMKTLFNLILLDTKLLNHGE